MNTTVSHVLRTVRAEYVRSGGRGPLWTVLLPVATVVPVGITVLIAYVAEEFARIPGQQYIQQVTTSNAAYWVVSITVVLAAVAAAYSQAVEYRNRSMEYVLCALPRRCGRQRRIHCARGERRARHRRSGGGGRCGRHRLAIG